MSVLLTILSCLSGAKFIVFSHNYVYDCNCSPGILLTSYLKSLSWVRVFIMIGLGIDLFLVLLFGIYIPPESVVCCL